MEDKIKISVIVPVYNTENVLEKCLESIINQTYENLEIILVNDGSEDNSINICEKYKEKDNRIIIINKENGGLSSARNEGINVATGDYISFVDSDDCIINNFYEYLVKLLVENKFPDIIQGSFERINFDDIEQAQDVLEERNKDIKEHIEVLANIEALEQLYGPNLKEYIELVVVWNKLYKKDLFDEIRFPERRLHEDEYTTYKLLYKSVKVVKSNIKIYGYIQTNNSIMRNPISQKRIDDTLNAYEEVYNFFDSKKERNLVIKAKRRYLEYCIELVQKIMLQEKDDEIDVKIKYILEKFKNFYSNNISFIEKNTINKKEIEIIEKIKEFFIKAENGGVNEENNIDGDSTP